MRWARWILALLTLAVLGPACLSDGGSSGSRNSPGTLQFKSAAFTIGESGGSATITVSRTGGSLGTAAVVFSVNDGTAVGGQDYTVPPGTGSLIWNDGETADQTITITVLDDSIEEENETVLLSLAAPSGATLGSPSSTTLRIFDDDSISPAGTLRFEPTSYTFYEGAFTLASSLFVPNVVTVTRVGGSTGAVSVMVVVSGGTATQGVDYFIATPGPLAGVVLSWADGETGPKRLIVDVLDDALIEGSETILLSLQDVTGGALIASPKAATVTIGDDESALAPPSKT